jgi:hypothetical protein
VCPLLLSLPTPDDVEPDDVEPDGVAGPAIGELTG